MNSIFQRVSVRNFTDQRVEEDKITTILKAAMAAPTAGNQQGWEFVIVDDPELLQQLSKVSPYAGPAGKATVAIVVVANQTNAVFPQYWEQDLGACSQNILLEAVELGLGAVWLGVAPEQERMKQVAKICSLPEHILAFGIIPIGYPANELKPRNNFDPNKIHYNKY